MSNELVKGGVSGTLTIRTMDDLARIGNMLAQSGFFTDSRDAAQAGVKVLAGLEMGIGAFSAMSGIHIIKGKPSVGAGLMAAAVKRHPRYDYRVRKHDATGCEIEFFQDGESIGTSTFGEADAKAAGLLGNDNYKRNPKNMYFARALSNGVRWYTPDVFDVSAYTPEELGADVDEDGNMVTVERIERPAEKPVERGALEPAKVEPVVELDIDEFPPEGDGPLFDKITGAQVKAITAAMKPLKLSPAQAKSLVEHILDHEIDGILTLNHGDGELLAEITTDQYTEALDAMRVPA